jgi:hypothetical protein
MYFGEFLREIETKKTGCKPAPFKYHEKNQDTSTVRIRSLRHCDVHRVFAFVWCVFFLFH